MTDYKYLPVMNANLMYSPFKWWKLESKDGILPYKYGLGSFHYIQGYHRKNFDMQDDFYLFGDSGGFSVVTLGATISPIECYQWQTENCETGVILDMPPYVFSGSAQFGGNAATIFNERLELTKRNVQLVKDTVYDKKSKMDWWIVIQGETQKQRERWFTELNKIHKFKGAALSPKPSYDWTQIVGQMLYAAKLKIKRIHVLQVSSLNSIALIMYVNQVLGEPFDFITFDSSTPVRLSAMGAHQVFDPKTFSLNNVINRHSLVCDCELCQQAKPLLEKMHWCTKNAVILRTTHSIKEVVKAVNFIIEMSEDELDKSLYAFKKNDYFMIKKMISHFLSTGEVMDFWEKKNYVTKSIFAKK